MERKSKHSVYHKHIKAEHGEEKDVKVEMRVTSRYRDCLNRQISEALAIRNAPQGSLLNSNSEFYQPCIKKKTICQLNSMKIRYGVTEDDPDSHCYKHQLHTKLKVK